MLVRTAHLSSKPPETLWPLLCNAQMDGSNSLPFRLGVPRPVACRLPDGAGGVGSRRECISNSGTIQQQILIWDPPRQLSFRMIETDIYFRNCVSAIEDTFELAPSSGGGTSITRTTRFSVIGRFAWFKGMLIAAALKHIHRYVFRNWDR